MGLQNNGYYRQVVGDGRYFRFDCMYFNLYQSIFIYITHYLRNSILILPFFNGIFYIGLTPDKKCGGSRIRKESGS